MDSKNVKKKTIVKSVDADENPKILIESRKGCKKKN